MAMEDEHWIERCDIYALDGEELKDFQDHRVAGCTICEGRARETHETLSLLHRSLLPVRPELDNARIIDQIDNEKVRSPGHSRKNRDIGRESRGQMPLESSVSSSPAPITTTATNHVTRFIARWLICCAIRRPVICRSTARGRRRRQKAAFSEIHRA